MSTGSLDSFGDSHPALLVLKKAFSEGRLAHGILFHGANLEATEDVAHTLAAVILGCDKERLKSHPDLFSLRPKNKMRQIGADATRELIRDIQHSPHESERKVALVYEADRMNLASANAFLKTLEEPPSDTTIFLITTRPYALLDTIRSRCLNFKIDSAKDAIEDEAWKTWLADYKAWINGLQGLSSGDKKNPLDMVMEVYRLVTEFDTVLKTLSKEALKKVKEESGAVISDEELVAQEVGIEKQIRQQLFQEIELETRNAVSDGLGQEGSEKLYKVTQELEKLVKLLEVNLNELAALEGFLLSSLRVWSAK